MALTGEIRKRSGLIVGAVGIALFAFLLSDYSSWLDGGPTERIVGKINGNPISYNEFEILKEQKEMLYRNAGFSIDNNEGLLDEVWEELKFKYFTEDQYEKAGIRVPAAEIVHMAVSNNPNSIMRQIFSQNGMGGFDRDFAIRYLNAVQSGQMEERDLYAWSIRQNLMTKTREIEKYSKYIVNGMYTTSFEAQRSYRNQEVQLTAKLVGLDYIKINPDSIKVTDADLQAYLDEHKEEFKQDEKAEIEYVLVKVNPSANDTNETLYEVTSQLDDFKAAEDDSAFLRRKTTVPYNKNEYQPRGSFDEDQEDNIFAADSGTVLGPFFSQGYFELVKVTGIKQDSVKRAKASHILFKPEGETAADTAKAYTEATKILAQIRGGADFAEMAREHSDGPSAPSGGELGWFGPGQMVKPFEDGVFSHHKGDVFITKTSFGVHIIKVTEEPTTKLVRVARLRKTIEPSADTRDSIYDIVEAVASKAQVEEDFEAIALDNGLQMKVFSEITTGQKSLPGVTDAGQLMRWIFDDENKVGATSDVMDLDGGLLVAKLIKKSAEGYATVDDVREELTKRVIKQKQGEILKAKIMEAMKKADTPEALAVELGTVVREIKGQSYQGATLQYFNNDFAIFGTLFGLPANNTPSQPILGDNGVYVAWVSEIKEPEAAPEDKLAEEKSSLNRRVTGGATGTIQPALNEAAGIKDYRYKFY